VFFGTKPSIAIYGQLHNLKEITSRMVDLDHYHQTPSPDIQRHSQNAMQARPARMIEHLTYARGLLLIANR
jgi:hypothetical protein